MKFTQIRNATTIISYAGKNFITDPWLQAEGSSFTAPSPWDEKNVPSPTSPLPMAPEKVLSGVDAAIITHYHPDHFDPETAAMMDKNMPVFVQSAEDAAAVKTFGFTDVRVLSSEGTVFEGVKLTKTPGQHGEKPEWAAGPSCGVIFTAEGEKILYVAGDTVYYQGVADTIDAFHPEVIVVNACGATIVDQNGPMSEKQAAIVKSLAGMQIGKGRIIMNAEDVLSVCRKAPEAAVIASHMEAVNHASVTRKDLKDFLKAHNAEDRVLIPADGESISF